MAACSKATSSSSIPTISASISNLPMRCSGCASSIPEVKVGGAALGQEPGVLRRRQYPHAGGRDPRAQGQLLQVHQRDPQRLRGFQREFRPALHLRRQRHRAGGGYELALAADHIMLADDGSAAVALPEVPLLAVLPGTGGLTRVADKRKVRRDHADFFCTIEEGVKGKRAVQWRLVDEIVPQQQARSRESPSAPRNSPRHRSATARARASRSRRSTRSFDDNGIRYGFVSVDINRAERIATITIKAPDAAAARRYRRHDRARRPISGRCRSRANSTTRSCICASTNWRPRCWCSSRRAIAPRCWPMTPFSKPTRRTGWPTKSGTTGSACSSASTSPRARWWRWSSRARASPARWPNSCSPPTAPTC